MATVVSNPFKWFTDRKGDPLDQGYVYVGDVNQDPELFPQATYWDIAQTIPAVQPLRTIAGYIVNPDAGNSPAPVYTASAYSIRVRDRNGVQVFYSPDSSKDSGGGFGSISVETLDQLKAVTPDTGTVSLLQEDIKGLFVWTPGNFTGQADDINIVKQDDTPLTTGAWVRQSAASTTFQALGTGALIRDAEDARRDFVSLADFCDTSDATAGFNKIAALYPGGVNIYVPAGTWTLTDTVTFAGQRVMIRGAGRNVTVFSFNPASPKSAFVLNNPALGGIYQSVITDIGFASGNSVDKTAIEIRNGADTLIARIGISGGNWLGSLSRGVATFGRQALYFMQSQVVCAQPLFIGPNATFPTLCSDHYALYDLELSGSSSTQDVITFADGVTLSMVTMQRIAITGGRHGIAWNDTTSTGASDKVRICGVRTEQGLDPAGFSIFFQSTVQNLQSLLMQHVQLDSARNGIFLNRALTVLGQDIFFNQTSGAALLMTGVAGSTLELDACASQPGASATLNNMREVEKSLPLASSAPIGPREFWRYEAARPFVANTQNYSDLLPERREQTQCWSIRDTLPNGTNTVILPLTVASAGRSSKVTIRTGAGGGQAGYGIFFVRPDGTIDTVSRLGNVNLGGGANTCRIISAGNLQLIGDAVTTPLPYTIEIEADYAI